ncbi:hypothetical protein XSR1_50129 [Xenorhabdus szentirmaii DSM 16338]|uniref:Antitermination protein Q n=1 Tax=Xenorhabdus szentirmaii DSM 16338 TaxID=1427518 RepID=W1J1U2_9GAMM|nr:hypothetical protein XSR1_50129 [Xenorhabdus szentirmaii DSM 16338]
MLMRDMRMTLSQWGAWASEGKSEVDWALLPQGLRDCSPVPERPVSNVLMMMVLRLMLPFCD